MIWMGILPLSFCVPVLGEVADSFTVRAEFDHSGGEIGVYGDLYSHTGSDPMALLLELEIPAGWRLLDIQAGGGAEGLNLTYGEGKEGRVRILLDGICNGGNDQPILRLLCEKDYMLYFHHIKWI